jgi:CheY-like chemotaxis protein
MSHRILVVEDHEPFRRFMSASLARRAETETFDVSDGAAALEKAEALRPDVILLDLGLPGLGGLDVARQLPRIAPRSKVLVISNELDPGIISEALRLGALGYLHKLRCGEDLMPAVDAVLDGRRFVSSLLASRHHHHHEVLFYSDDGVLIEGFSRFAGASLKAGGAAIVLATESHRDGVVRTLRAAGVDIDQGIERGRCVLLDAAAALERIMVDGAPDRFRFLEGLRGLVAAASDATEVDHPRVAICSECVGLLCAKGDLETAIYLEKTGNDLGKTYDVDVLCAYPLPGWRDDDSTFDRICMQHSAVRYV